MERLLWEFSFRATLIAAGTGVVLATFRIRTAAARHAAWASVIVFMLLLPSWTAWAPKVPIRLLSPVADKTGTNVSQVSVAVPPIADAGEHQGSEWGRNLLAGIYLLGFCTLLARLLVGTVRANRLARCATEQSGKLTNPSCTAPMTVGWLRPKVILPEYWLQWPQAQLDAVMTHEREHVRRRDPLVQWVALLNRAIFWFHPLAWWLERRLSALAEEACDAAVLASGQDARAYSEYLLDIARSVMQAGGRLDVTAAAMPGSFLPARLRQILEKSLPPRISRARAVCTTMACALATGVFAGGTLDHARTLQKRTLQEVAGPEVARPKETRPPTMLAQAAPKPVPAAPRQIPEAYRKWLDEEVVYLVTPAERTRFLSLGSDEERQQFIEQFWSRRDPIGGPPNAFREEHYRRIAYANDRFGFADMEGWRSDRGKIYILYGPPDELEEHLTPIPSQRWRYRYVDGIGNDVIMEFIDTAKNGEFHMTLDPNGKGKDFKRPSDPVSPETPKPEAAKPSPAQPEALAGAVIFLNPKTYATVTRQYGVHPDGKNIMPLLQAAGLTSGSVGDYMTRVLAEYIAKPDASFTVIQVNSKNSVQLPK